MTPQAHPVSHVGVALSLVGFVWAIALAIAFTPIWALVGAVMVSAGILMIAYGAARSDEGSQ